MALNSLVIKVGLDPSEFSSGLKNMERGLTKFSKKAESLGQSMSTYITLPLLALGTASVMAYSESAKAVAQVEAGLKSTGNAAGFTSQQLQQMAADIQSTSVFDDDAILKDVTAQLLTFTNIAGTEFKTAQQAIADFSARTGKDLYASSIMIGKALNDPVKGLTALGKAGVQFSEEQKTLINSLVKTGDVAGAQKIILAELEKQYGGSAKAAAEAGLGPIEQLKNTLGDLSEEFGKIILDGISPFVDSLKGLVSWFQGLDESTKKTIVQVAGIAAAIGPLIFIIGKLGFALKALMASNPFTLIATVIATVLITAITYFSNKLGGLSNLFELLKAVAVATWKTIVAWISAVGKTIGYIVTRWADLLLAPWKALALAIKGDLTGAKEVISNALRNPITDVSDIMAAAADETKTLWEEVSSLKKGFENQAKAADKAAASVENYKKAANSPGGGGGGGAGVSVKREKSVDLQVMPVIGAQFEQEINVLEGTVLEKIPINMNVGISKKSMTDTYAMVQQFASDVSMLLKDSFAQGFEMIGETIGNMMTGGTLKDGIMSMVGMLTGFMKQLGKMLIGVGVAQLALELALESMNPYLAIAGGVALIAIATAANNFIKGGIDGKATGGISNGGLTMVGERGPELMNLPRGTAVTNATRTRNMMNGSGGGTLSTKISGYDLEILLNRSQVQNQRR